jgi:dipeptidase
MMKQKSCFATLILILTLSLLLSFNSPLSVSSAKRESIGIKAEEIGETDGCTTLLAMPDSTANGNLIIGKNRDLKADACQHIIIQERKNYPQGSTIRCRWEEIPQVRQTYKWIGSKTWDSWGIGMGVNEYLVAIVINDASSNIREKGQANKGLGGDEVARLVLERCKSAKEGVKLIGELVNLYGHAEDSVGQIYVIADSSEAWIFEGTTSHWVAKRIREGIEARANEFQIGRQWDLGSRDIIDYAIEQGWCKSQKDFYFARAYTEDWPLNHSKNRYERAIQLLAQDKGKLTMKDFMQAFRDHYEGTEHYETPPHYFSSYLNRSICVNYTATSWIIELRKDYPKDIAAQIWICLSSPCTSVYTPFYLGNRIPKEFSEGNDSYSPDSAWWQYEKLQRWIEEDYQKRIELVRNNFSALEDKEILKILEIEREYLNLYKHEMKVKASKLIQDYSISCILAGDEEVKSLLSKELYKSIETFELTQ